VAIREVTATRGMPPWSRVRGFGRLAAGPSLSQEEIQLIADWVNGGAAEGDPRLSDPALPRLAAAGAAEPRGIPIHDGLRLPEGALNGFVVRELGSSTHVRLLV
jgi:2-keto-4-pentenoate hydratase